MGHFHGHSDHALQASYHHLVLGVARHSLASGFIRGRLASLFEAKGNRVKTLSFFPGLDLRAVVDLSRPYDCRTSRSSTLMSPSIGLGGHRISY